MSEPVLSLEELRAYFDGVFNATAALKGRLARLGPGQRPSVREVGRYQAMAREYLDALAQTIALRAGAAGRDELPSVPGDTGS